MTKRKIAVPPQGSRSSRGRRWGDTVPVPPSSSSSDGRCRACGAGALHDRATACGGGGGEEDAFWRTAQRTMEVLMQLLEERRHGRRTAQEVRGGGSTPPRKEASYASVTRGGHAGGGRKAYRTVGTQTAPPSGGFEEPPPRCFKCLVRGHIRRNCPSAADRSKNCLRCGAGGHMVGQCRALRPHCPVCEESGRDASHRIGGRSCPVISPARGGARRRKGVGGQRVLPTVSVEVPAGENSLPAVAEECMEVDVEAVSTCGSASTLVMDTEVEGGEVLSSPSSVTVGKGEVLSSPSGVVMEGGEVLSSPPPTKRSRSPSPKKRKVLEGGKREALEGAQGEGEVLTSPPPMALAPGDGEVLSSPPPTATKVVERGERGVSSSPSPVLGSRKSEGGGASPDSPLVEARAPYTVKPGGGLLFPPQLFKVGGTLSVTRWCAISQRMVDLILEVLGEKVPPDIWETKWQGVSRYTAFGVKGNGGGIFIPSQIAKELRTQNLSTKQWENIMLLIQVHIDEQVKRWGFSRWGVLS